MNCECKHFANTVKCECGHLFCPCCSVNVSFMQEWEDDSDYLICPKCGVDFYCKCPEQLKKYKAHYDGENEYDYHILSKKMEVPKFFDKAKLVKENDIYYYVDKYNVLVAPFGWYVNSVVYFTKHFNPVNATIEFTDGLNGYYKKKEVNVDNVLKIWEMINDDK